MNRMARLIATAAIMTSSFATVLNTSMIRVASPELQAFFGFSYSELTWVGNSYQIAYAVLLPVLGLIGDKYGRKRSLSWGLGVFAFGSLVSGFAWNFWSLVSFRVVQAVGAAAIFPNAVAAAMRLYPEEQRGRVMGIWGMAISLGSVSGPSIGGIVLEYFSWQSIFLINLPVALLALASIIYTVAPDADSGKPGAFRFDISGSAVLLVMIVSLVTGMQAASDAGWGSPLAISLLLVFSLCIPLFARIEAKAHEPIVDLGFVKSRAFLSGLYCGGMHLVAIQATQFMMPLYLANVLGMDSLAIGFLLVPQAAIRLVISPMAGYLEDKYGSRLPVSLGIVVRTVSLTALALLTPSSSYMAIMLTLLADGAGAALVWSPSMNAVLRLAPAEKTSSITGVFNMLRFIMGTVGVVIVGLVLDATYTAPQSPTSLVPGYYQSYVVLAVLTGAGLLAARHLATKTNVGANTSAAD